MVDAAAQRGEPLPVRFAALLHDLGKALTPPENWPHHYAHEALGLPAVEAVCARLKVPVDCRDLALLATREHGNVHQSLKMRATTLTALIERCDALRRPERFAQLLAVCECDYLGRPGYRLEHYQQPARLRAALAAFASVDAGQIARVCQDKTQIPAQLHAARAQAVRAALPQQDG